MGKKKKNNTYEERMKTLHAKGQDTKKYFTLQIPRDTPAGTIFKVEVVDDTKGRVSVLDKESEDISDPLVQEIITNGYVRNTKLHRRFVMAQYMRLISVADQEFKGSITKAINVSYGFRYSFMMMLKEMKVLGELQKYDEESFNERAHFFRLEVVDTVLDDYFEVLKLYAENPSYIKKCKGIPYTRIGSENVFIDDLKKKVYAPVLKQINAIKKQKTYDGKYRMLQGFMKYYYISLPSNTKKSKAWIDAFKGAGAYYTLKNMIMFHDVTLKDFDNNGKKLNRDESLELIKSKLETYEGYQYHAMLMEAIEDSEFNFKKSIEAHKK